MPGSILNTQHVSHGLGGFLLCRSGDMGICVKGKPSGEVAQHAGHRFDDHAVLEGDGGEGVAEVVESNLLDACSLQHPLEHIVDAVRRDGSAVRRGENILVFHVF